MMISWFLLAHSQGREAFKVSIPDQSVLVPLLCQNGLFHLGAISLILSIWGPFFLQTVCESIFFEQNHEPFGLILGLNAVV